mmetsp:Transcript_8789/g.6530  ORF Transcript_8789/g.6530 Transcript_8789/m.6530 type:complete len:88 (+) Transcript_8789:336-599(+)
MHVLAMIFGIVGLIKTIYMGYKLSHKDYISIWNFDGTTTNVPVNSQAVFAVTLVGMAIHVLLFKWGHDGHKLVKEIKNDQQRDCSRN